MDYCRIRNHRRKLCRCKPRNHHWKPFLTAHTEIFTAYGLFQNQKSLTKTESVQTHKSSPEPSSTADAEIFSAHRLLQNQKSLIKTESLQNGKSSQEPSSTAVAEIFSAHRLLQNQKSFTKTVSVQNQKSSPETSSTADTEILRRKTAAESEIMDENWVAADPEMITGNQFHG